MKNIITRKFRIISALLLCLCITTSTLRADTIVPIEGTWKPQEFTLTDLDQQLHRLADYQGKVLLINFWASWCTPCITEMPGIQRLSDALKDQPFEILTINVSDVENRIREFLKRMNLNLTVLLDSDGKVFNAWHGKVLPASYLVDGNGMIRYHVIGPMEWDNDKVHKIIVSLIKQH